MAADWIHAYSEAGEDGVASNVGEADGEGATSEREWAEVAEEEHGDDGAGVEQKTVGYHWNCQGENRLNLCNCL